MEWILQSPSGEVYETDDLKKFVRENEELFENGPKRFYGGIYTLRNRLVNEQGQKAYKGWTLIKYPLPGERKRAPKKEKAYTYDILWEDGYAHAKDYYKEHGNINAPVKHKSADGYPLGVWVQTQRSAKRKGKITTRRVELLEKLGITWTERTVRDWEYWYSVAKAYYEANGNLDVPTTYDKETGIFLNRWLYNKRAAYNGLGTMRITQSEIEALTKIGMDWSKPSYKKRTKSVIDY